MKPIAWIYKYCRKYVWAIVLLAAAGMLSAGGFILLALISSRLLDTVTGVKNGNGMVYCGLLAAIVVLQGILNIFYSNLRMHVMGKTEIAMQKGILDTICKKKYSEITRIHSGELLNRFTSDIEVITQGIVEIVPQFMALTTRLLTGLLVLFSIDASFTVCVLGIGFALCLGSRIYSRHFRHLHREVQESSGKVRSFMQECVENLQVIKSFSNEQMIRKNLQDRQQVCYQKKVRRNAASNVANTAAYVIFTGGYYAALAWGAFRIAEGVLTFGGLTAFLQILNQLRMPFRNVSGLIPRYYSMLSSAERIMELEQREDESAQAVLQNPEQFYESMRSLAFDKVMFSYEDREVLNEFSFSVKKGELAVLMGTSGRGKSTVMKLLLGLYSCQSGRIFFETQEQEVLADAGTRCMFAYVPQGNLILSGTIRENIAFFQSGLSEQTIVKAAKAACIWEYIQQLPQGLDTVLRERGAGLSEGQIQRIAIARAICSGAPILLLDECTSALDEETEQEVLIHLKEMKTKTILCVSHRRAALECCDRALKIEEKV